MESQKSIMKQTKQNLSISDKGNRLYFTSDHLAFFDEEHAIRHAKDLSDKRVTERTREEVEQETKSIGGGKWNDEEMNRLLDELSGE